MTFFTARGGNTNEGRMAINGMVVAAAFNGGGVSSLTYDANNVEEVSVVVSGGMGESDVGGPVMNLVPKTGGNRFAGQMFFNTAGDWSRGDNLDDYLRESADADHAGPGDHQLVRFQPLVRRADQARQALVLWRLPQFRDGAGRRRHLREQVRPRPGALGLSRKTRASRARNVQGRNIYQGRVTAQVDAEEPRDVLARVPAALRRVDADALRVRAAGTRGADWIGARLDHAVAGSQHRLLQSPVLRDAGDVDRAGHQPHAARRRVQPLRVLDQRRTRASCRRTGPWR